MQPTSLAAMSGGWPSRPENGAVVRAGPRILDPGHNTVRRFPPGGLGLDGLGAAGPS